LRVEDGQGRGQIEQPIAQAAVRAGVPRGVTHASSRVDQDLHGSVAAPLLRLTAGHRSGALSESGQDPGCRGIASADAVMQGCQVRGVAAGGEQAAVRGLEKTSHNRR
jgi:hypothetical protein